MRYWILHGMGCVGWLTMVASAYIAEGLADALGGAGLFIVLHAFVLWATGFNKRV